MSEVPLQQWPYVRTDGPPQSPTVRIVHVRLSTYGLFTYGLFTYGLFTYGLFMKSLRSPLCGTISLSLSHTDTTHTLTHYTHTHTHTLSFAVSLSLSFTLDCFFVDRTRPWHRGRAGRTGYDSGYGYCLSPYGAAYRRALRTTCTRLRTRAAFGA
jgi:hypothetical protein